MNFSDSIRNRHRRRRKKPINQLEMWRQGQNLLRRAWLSNHSCGIRQIITGSASSSSPNVSIWRRKKEMGKEGLVVAKELKRLQSNSVRLDRFMKSHVSRLLKSDLVAVLAEFQRQDLTYLSMRVIIHSLCCYQCHQVVIF